MGNIKTIARRMQMGHALLAFLIIYLSKSVDADAQLQHRYLKPNVVLIVADDLGYGDLGCYGQQAIQTPNLDQLAASGMKFSQFYSGATVCAPSRCVLMTGQHGGKAEIRGNKEIKPMGQWPITDGAFTLGELFKSAGYQTGLIGKWGLGAPGTEGAPNNQGFDYFFGYLCQRHAHNYYPEFLFRNSQRVPLDGNVVPNDREDGAGFATERHVYSHDLLAEEALEFVERNQERPFFLYVPFTIPHANNEGGKLGMEVPSLGQYANRDWPEPQKGHAAMISRMDRDIGRLVQRLDSLGLRKNTLVLFTSDNGPHREGGNDPDFNDSNGPLRGIKRDLYEGGIRVPLIANWPGRVTPGSVSDHVGYFGDFMATFADLLEIGAPWEAHSISMLPTLLSDSNRRQKEHSFLYWEFHTRFRPEPEQERTIPALLQAARQGDWKAVLKPNGEFELYDLSTDIGETQDVHESHPDIAQRLRRILSEERVESEHWPVAQN